jgi:ABC-2 type transport system ATP-binding protein
MNSRRRVNSDVRPPKEDPSLTEPVSEQAEFWSKVARKYDRVVDLSIGPSTRSMVRERVAEEARLGHLAEFGCGTGFYTQVLAGKADALVATDISPGMLEVAKQHVKAANVTFQVEDCQRTSFPNATFDAAFISLVLHFTEPGRTLAEMHRILKPSGMLIIVNLDPKALSGLDRLRSVVRILYRGITGYRVKPPKGFGQNALTEKQLCERLEQSGFRVVSTETFRDPSRSSNIPVEYVRAAKS